MIIGIFEMHSITNVTMLNHVKDLLYIFGLLDKVITDIKYEGSILSAFFCALTFVVFCSTFKITCLFNLRSCFGYMMPKVA